MGADFLANALPKSVFINGMEYLINWNYRVWMQFEVIRSENSEDKDKILKLLQLCYPKIPENIGEAIDKMLWFYRCGEEEHKEENKQRYQRRESKSPAFSFTQDAPYIYAAFKEQYRIDLTECDMHWWKFMALFESLNEDTKMSKIMYYRKASTSGMPKERRAFINEMKKLYRIRDESGTKKTLQERNQGWLDYVKSRHGGEE